MRTLPVPAVPLRRVATGSPRPAAVAFRPLRFPAVPPRHLWPEALPRPPFPASPPTNRIAGSPPMRSAALPRRRFARRRRSAEALPRRRSSFRRRPTGSPGRRRCGLRRCPAIASPAVAGRPKGCPAVGPRFDDEPTRFPLSTTRPTSWRVTVRPAHPVAYWATCSTTCDFMATTASVVRAVGRRAERNLDLPLRATARGVFSFSGRQRVNTPSTPKAAR
ncbi:hypothetical protein STSO111631_21560 [Stackebrandtia soli]